MQRPTNHNQQQNQYSRMSAMLPSSIASISPAAFDDIEVAASPLFALGLCLDSSPLYYLAVAKRLQELHELSSSSFSDDEELLEEEDEEECKEDLVHRSPASASAQYNNNNGATEHKKMNGHITPVSSSSNVKGAVSDDVSKATVPSIVGPSNISKEQEAYVATYRMSSRTVEDFLRLLTGSGALGRNTVSYEDDVKIDPMKALQVGLRYLGSQETLDEISQAFKFSSPTTVRRVAQSTIKAIAAVASQLIYWPTKRDAAQHQADLLFTNSFGLYGTIGVIGWSQLIKKADENALSAYLQGVVDHRLRFIDTACILPSDKQDSLSSIFQQSNLFRKLHSDATRADLLPSETHILAPQLRVATPPPVQWMVARYATNSSESEGDQLLAEKTFNRHVCRVAAVTVREAFRQLLRRFPRLSVLSLNDEACDDIKATVLASSVLHNFCIDRKESLPKSSIANRKTKSGPILGNNSSIFTITNNSNNLASSSVVNVSNIEDKRDKIAKELTTPRRSRSKKVK